jgi:hypothetical protein
MAAIGGACELILGAVRTEKRDCDQIDAGDVAEEEMMGMLLRSAMPANSSVSGDLSGEMIACTWAFLSMSSSAEEAFTRGR